MIEPKPDPCGSCPYRINAPSGLWDEEEYDKLTRYDGTIADQAAAKAFYLFRCHSTPLQLCSGWVGHRRDPGGLLALRLGVSRGDVHEDVMDYETTAELFPTGRAAAEHGMRDIENPGPEARAAMAKVQRLRSDLVYKEASC